MAAFSMSLISFFAAALLVFSMDTKAHVIAELPAKTSPWAWQFEPWVVILLLLSLGLYIAGFVRLWQHARYHHGVHLRELIAFVTGWLAMVIALISPLDSLGNWLFSAHMLQHEILMIVAAPLMILGKPLGIWIWAFPLEWRIKIGSVTFIPAIDYLWKALTHPFNAWVLHAMALWLWHIPALFDAALRNTNIHVLQHFSFLFSALLFWWSVIGKHTRASHRGWAMISIFTTMLHTGALGVLLTLSSQSWYPIYDQTFIFGMSPLEDQQLGGLIMWVPAGLAYLIAGLTIAANWLIQRPKSL
jgi:cytochrome c oxidase assembly factor CtaG